VRQAYSCYCKNSAKALYKLMTQNTERITDGIQISMNKVGTADYIFIFIRRYRQQKVKKQAYTNKIRK